MRDVFNSVGLPVREVVNWVNIPLVASARMGGAENAINHRISHVHIARCHVNLGPQCARPFREFARPHAAKEIQILVHRALAIGAVAARFGQGAAEFAHLVGVEIIDVGLAFANQVLGPFVKDIEIIGGEIIINT